MRTIVLRFAESFAPECRTIAVHQELTKAFGHVWYGKPGNPVSLKIISEILENDDSQVQLIHRGGQERYWAHIDAIQRSQPEVAEIPACYRDIADKFKCWFRILSFERAANSVMSNCAVVSSGKKLTEASRHSMSPYLLSTTPLNRGFHAIRRSCSIQSSHGRASRKSRQQ